MKTKLLALIPFVTLASCGNLTPEQNDRIIDAAVPVVTEIVIRATK